MFCIWAFVPFVAEEMLTPRVVLDIFLLKNYLSSTSNYLDRCCVQKKKISLFTPTKDKHFMDCCKQYLWIFIFFSFRNLARILYLFHRLFFVFD